METIKTDSDEWEIFFLEKEPGDTTKSTLDLRLRIQGRREGGNIEISDEEFEELKEDLKDLGKWRKYKKLKKDLNENG